MFDSVIGVEIDIAEFAGDALRANADPENAVVMAAYMKTEMPFYGVASGVRKEIVRDIVARFPISDQESYEAAVRELWARPHREEKYVAIGIARRLRSFIVMESLPLYRDMIVEGAWWDFVDEIAAHLIGSLWRANRERIDPVVDEWIADDNLWLRRTAILGQLRHKSETDAVRLFRFCEMRMHETEFFVRKAIGWALREYAKCDPQAVADFLSRNRQSLSGLSYREGGKHLIPAGLVPPC